MKILLYYMEMHGFRKSFLLERPMTAIKLDTKFIQEVIKWFKKDFQHFPKFLFKCKFTKSTSLL